MNRLIRQLSLALLVIGSSVTSPAIVAETAAPYGKASEDLYSYPIINVVLDAYCRQPERLADIFDDLENISKTLNGRVIVVVHGGGVAVFARKNYERYRATVDHLARLARQGVQFRLDKPAVAAAGFDATDMHGFATVISSGLAEIAAAQNQGSRYLRFIPHHTGARTKQGHGASSPDKPTDEQTDEQTDEEPRFRFSM